MATPIEKGEVTALSRNHGWWQRALGGLLLVWSVAAAVSALNQAIALEPDPMAALDAEFKVFAVYLPPADVIGYLEPYDGWTTETIRMHYAAQYALSPRVVAARADREYLIVARGTERPGGDPRLNGFEEIARFPGGHRLFRRSS